jgi:hypothetical protein
MVPGCSPRNFHSGAIDLFKFAGQALLSQSDVVCPKCVGKNHLAAGPHVRPGNSFDTLRKKQIPGVGRLSWPKPQGLKLRTPRAVGDDRPGLLQLLNRIHEC